MNSNQVEVATLAGGCFWCTEAIFKRLKGVESVLSGYAGDDGKIPNYDRVSMGNTPYAEAVQIKYDPEIISFENILDVFFATHNPTTLNKQGNDVGTQYRSAVFFHDQMQKEAAEKSIQNHLKDFSDPIVTTLEPFTKFFSAEDYHLDYYKRNPNNPYCQLVIDPKIQKLYKNFKDHLKPEAELQ
ncbi:MAG: msrA [Candidatus Doudnabacteria bacterium]|nr:msrA [Candidatus Doudnabacteria bacterium]